MRKTACALKRLFSANNKEEMQPRWHLYAGKKDASVNYTEFESLPPSQDKKKVTFFSRGDHALQFGHHSGTVNRQMLKDIKNCFSDKQFEVLDVNRPNFRSIVH